MARRSAFTLIELLVATVVLAALVAFSVPTYQLILSQLQLSAAVDESIELLRNAQQKTVTEQKMYGVRLNNGASAIYLFSVENDGTTVVRTTLDLPSNIRVNSVAIGGGNEIRFTINGGSTVSGTVSYIDRVRSRTRAVEIRSSGNIIKDQNES